VHTSTVQLNDLSGPVCTEAAVVVDVMRAFTAAPWCFARGAAAVYLAADVESAVASRTNWPDALLLKDGATDPRFDLPNAPGVVRGADLRARTVVQVTGNGTRGAHAVAGVDLVLCAAFVTARATARALRDAEVGTVTFVVTEGDEDSAFADYLTAILSGETVDAAPYLRRAETSPAADELRRRADDSRHPGVHPDDVELCLELDEFDFALRAEPAGRYLRLAVC
jgi:2-phosphosulfolactate phosphatase